MQGKLLQDYLDNSKKFNEAYGKPQKARREAYCWAIFT